MTPPYDAPPAAAVRARGGPAPPGTIARTRPKPVPADDPRRPPDMPEAPWLTADHNGLNDPAFAATRPTPEDTVGHLRYQKVIIKLTCGDSHSIDNVALALITEG